MVPGPHVGFRRVRSQRRQCARQRVAMAALLLLSGGLMPSPVAAQQRTPLDGGNLPEVARLQMEAVLAEKAQRTPGQRKIGSHLLYADRMRRGQPPAPGVSFGRMPIAVSPDGRVEVDIRADVTPGLLDGIAALGGTISNSVPSHRAVRAILPLDQVEALAALGEVQFIDLAEQPIRHAQTWRRPIDSDEFLTNAVNSS